MNDILIMCSWISNWLNLSNWSSEKLIGSKSGHQYTSSDAIVSAIQYCQLRTLLHMQSCPVLCKNRPADMYMTVCARVSERACTEPTYHVFFMIAANTQRTNISHVIHGMHSACKKNGERIPSTKGVYFGTTAYAYVSGRTQLHYAAVSGIAYAKPSADIIAYAIMSSGYYCIQDIIACDTGQSCHACCTQYLFKFMKSCAFT